jgi:hypothetical protein
VNQDHHRLISNFMAWVAAVLSLIACPMGAAPSAHPARQYVDGEVIVVFKPSASLDTARRTLQARSLEFTTHFAFISQKWGRQSGLVRAKKRTTAALMAELSQHPSVEVVEPNYLRWICATTPNDPLFSLILSLRNAGQPINGIAGPRLRHLTPGARPSTLDP